MPLGHTRRRIMADEPQEDDEEEDSRQGVGKWRLGNCGIIDEDDGRKETMTNIQR